MEIHPLLLINNGLHIISAKKGERFNGLIAQTVFQIQVETPAVVIAVNKNNLTHNYIQASGAFTLSVLEKEAPMSLIKLFDDTLYFG